MIMFRNMATEMMMVEVLFLTFGDIFSDEYNNRVILNEDVDLDYNEGGYFVVAVVIVIMMIIQDIN